MIAKSKNEKLPKHIVYCGDGQLGDEPAMGLLDDIIATLKEFGFADQERFRNYIYFWLRQACFARQFFVGRKHVGLIVGPTGCGKTTSVQVMSEKLGIPCSVEDVSKCVQDGIKGSTITSIVSDLFQRTKKSGEKWHQPRILVLDEIHSLINKNSYYGEGVLRQMLSLLAGEPINAIRSYKSGEDNKPSAKIPTDLLSIILIGSFEGTLTRTTPGSYASGDMEKNNDTGKELASNSTQEIINRLEVAGIPGELLGRLTLPPIVLPGPTKKDLDKALRRKDARNPLPELLASLVTRKLIISPVSVEHILSKTMKLNLGYRGLRQVCEEFMCQSLSALRENAKEI